MSLKIAASLMALSLLSVADGAQTITFWSSPGGSSDVDGALKGAILNDQLGGQSYSGFVGELMIMPTDPGFLSALPSNTSGMATADADGLFGSTRGLVGFCIDSETPFRNSSDLTRVFEYQPLNFAAAEARYQSDRVDSYLANSLKRAAYLIETFYVDAHSRGEDEGAALQTAIWEVLYDADPDVSAGSGNYSVRNNTGSLDDDTLANRVITTANTWLGQAEADDWGGADYDPDERVIFWIDPEDTSLNQSVISLSLGNALTPVPEPASMLLLGIATLVTASRRHRSHPLPDPEQAGDGRAHQV